MNSFGKAFRVTIAGESRSPAILAIVDGCPPGIPLSESDFLKDLRRRKPLAKGTTPRKESDLPKLLSGVYNGKTTGAPITIAFENDETSDKDYDLIKRYPRPGHADFTSQIKYQGFDDPRGGGAFSGRMTLTLVSAGVIAKKILAGIRIGAELIEAGGSENVEQAVAAAAKAGDSIGGIVECAASGVTVGLGEPFFDSIESAISAIVFSIPGAKAIEFGDHPRDKYFNAGKARGSDYRDDIIEVSGKTRTNRDGGVCGGISNGNDIVFRTAFKPAPSSKIPIKTIDMQTGQPAEIKIPGRSDVCYALRAPVIVEAACAIALADLISRNLR